MIISRTPFRVSFFGGGSDYPVYYKEHGGTVLNSTINKYCYITCRYLPPVFVHKYRICYSKIELVNSIDEIRHPAVRECLRFMNISEGIEVVHAGDLPARSGIGSSSSFTVGLLNALYALKGQMVTKRQLAADAIHVEQEMIPENVGSQDQVAAAFGGFNRIEFGGQDGFWVQSVTIGEEKLRRLQNSLLFCFTGLSRQASAIAGEQIAQTPSKLREIAEMRKMADEAVKIVNGNVEALNDFGRLLDETWKLKKSLTKLISSSEIDNIYDTARRAGALGGKLCGAGGGGFFLLFVPPERQKAVKDALKDLLFVDFRFETLGSHIVFYAT